MKRYFAPFLILIITIFSIQILPQPTYFNINEYKQFLLNNRNMTGSQLLDMHPAGFFEGNINTNYNSALYFDSVNIKLNLTEYEKSLIQKHGFMVSERLSRNFFGQSFLEVYHKDLPVYVSTDAILHAFHRSYNRILRDVEIGFIINQLTQLLTSMHSKMPQLAARYTNNSEMDTMLHDVDVYLTVARKLLNQNVNPYYSANNIKINELLTLIAEENLASYNIFASTCREIDFSQFKPRGHYAGDIEHPELEKYFRAMMWLGRIELYLFPPSNPSIDCEILSKKDVQRQVIDAVLISELFELAQSQSIYVDIESILEFFVGKPDNVTLDNIKFLKNAIGIQFASELLDTLVLNSFQDTLKNQVWADQLILSQILLGNGSMSPESVKPASAFMLFGQRFVIDSYVTGNVIYDKIFYNNKKICRLFPSPLDPMFALGNNATAQLLVNELEQYKYSSNLAALRYLINSYGSDFWDSTIYNMWLNNIRTLNPPNDRTNLPKYMQTAAFWQKQLNTQLASWTQLRHDNLLYAKQSYTPQSICSYPYAYVEPIPEFYEGLKKLANVALIKFPQLNFNNVYLKGNIIAYFNTLRNVTDSLGIIVNKQLNNIQLNDQDINFLKRIIYTQYPGSGTPPYGGWYARLFYNDPEGTDALMIKDNIVADIHTVPTDCVGNGLGAVVHVGTGPVNLGVFVVKTCDSLDVTFVGPALSYFEYTTTNFLRLTDQEWDLEYLQQALRPNWVNLYLADSSGNSKGPGNNLFIVTSVNDDNNDVLPQSQIIVQNYPNPFNSTTIISFNVPSHLSNNQVELSIFNINGQLINTLLNETLPSGNYLTKWEGNTADNKKVAGGVYFYNLKVGAQSISGKMTLLK